MDVKQGNDHDNDHDIDDVNETDNACLVVVTIFIRSKQMIQLVDSYAMVYNVLQNYNS